jgi:hypothetical protein
MVKMRKDEKLKKKLGSYRLRGPHVPLHRQLEGAGVLHVAEVHHLPMHERARVHAQASAKELGGAEKLLVTTKHNTSDTQRAKPRNKCVCVW